MVHAGDSTLVVFLAAGILECLTVDKAAVRASKWAPSGRPRDWQNRQPVSARPFSRCSPPYRDLMRNIEEHRARIAAIEPAVQEIQDNFSCEQALCLMADEPWADHRVLLVTRARVLRAANKAVISAGDCGVAELLVNLPAISEAAVWQVACEQLETGGLFCAWPVDLDGQFQFIEAAASFGLESDAERLMMSIRSNSSPERHWEAYVSKKLRRVAEATDTDQN
jgi:hypothetical protein